jgi:hypothetical protein
MRVTLRQKDNQAVPPRATLHSSAPSCCMHHVRRLQGRALVPPYVMLLLIIVYCCAPFAALAGGPAKPAPPTVWPVTSPLPPAAQDMYEAIMSAVHSGAIEDLKVAYDLGELKADIADAPVTDPVAYWRKLSGDGEGREILAIIANLFAVGPADVARGKDPENAAVYVWPYLAELPFDNLTPAQQVDLLRVATAAEAKTMMEKKTYTGWRLTIGADGIWHTFKRGK